MNKILSTYEIKKFKEEGDKLVGTMFPTLFSTL